jgi:tRNA 2-thiocytidine biosynthesis protein TtcA
MASVEREVRRLLGRGIHEYDLIQDGDRITVGISGGKDSLLLLWLLRDALQRAPVHYDLVAIHVDLGFDTESAIHLEGFLRKEGFDYEMIRTDYGLKAHGPDNPENPCFLCARLRKAALFRKAQQLNCPKIALAHNQDDFIETFMINILYSGQIAGMMPKQPFFEGLLTVIRPLVFVPATKVERLCRRLGLPIIPNPCPTAHRNIRAEIRAHLKALYKQNPKIRGNIFHSMSNINPDYLLPSLRS